MKVNTTVHVKLSDAEVIELIADKFVPLAEDEKYIVVNSYSSMNDYTFSIVKKDEDD